MKFKIAVFAFEQLIFIAVSLFCLYDSFSLPGLFPCWMDWILIVLGLSAASYYYRHFKTALSGRSRQGFLSGLLFAALLCARGTVLQVQTDTDSDFAEYSDNIPPLKVSSNLQNTSRANDQIIYPFSVFVSGMNSSETDPCFVLNINPQTQQILILCIPTDSIQNESALSVKKRIESALDINIRDSVQVHYDNMNSFLDTYGPFVLETASLSESIKQNIPAENASLNSDQLLQLLKAASVRAEDIDLCRAVLDSLWQKISQPDVLFNITQTLDSLPNIATGDIPRPVLTQLISQQINQNLKWTIQCIHFSCFDDTEDLSSVRSQTVTLLESRF